MIDVKIKTNNKKVIRIINSFAKRFPKEVDKAMGNAAQWAQVKILDRTSKGKSVTGGSFKPYTESYHKWKAQRGGAFFNGIPNLRLHGNMLGSMDNRKKGHLHWQIFFRRKEEELKASYHDNLGVGKRGKNLRPFFDLNMKEEAHIEKMVEKAIDIAIKT